MLTEGNHVFFSSRESRSLVRHIEQDPIAYDDPGFARLRHYPGVHIWSLAYYVNKYSGEINKVADDFRVPDRAVKTAMLYYRQNKASIDLQLERFQKLESTPDLTQ